MNSVCITFQIAFMKPIILTLSLLVVTFLCGFETPAIKIEKSFSDRKIRKIEQQVLQRYGIKVDVTVISRNAKREITNLELVRYNKDGKKGGSCSSDKFGVLVITQTGCQIADAGYEQGL